MASSQEPEVQFAQRLASNERPVRTRALKKLRKYIYVRSQSASGRFTGDELLKLWKGLFYCLWMQDKLLLQEELSNRISNLIHSFQDTDGQLLFLESFIQTFKREWTGIDRLRMDKFYQLVRFMFRQTFEMLKRRSWESSVVSRFLELLTVQLLQSGSEAPAGLQFHVLDLYLGELAAVGSAELTAEQNLQFIEPFCRTAARTKDHTLFRSICSSIFSNIIDQAPFAIEDLMKELKAAETPDSDSGQASDEDEEDPDEETINLEGQKATKKQVNGNESDEEEDDNDDDEELLHLEDSDTEAPCDEDVGPVLQFDYGALANTLFALSSRSSTPGKSRTELYRTVRVLRNLSRGVFPQDDLPQEVSTDEDDDMFCSRKRMKRRRRRVEEEGGEEAPAVRKRKGNSEEAAALNQHNQGSAEDGSEPADLPGGNEKKKKKKKRRKKKKGGVAAGNAERSAEDQSRSQEADQLMQSSTTPGGPDPLPPPEVNRQLLPVTGGTSDPTPPTSTNQEPPGLQQEEEPSRPETQRKKKKKKKKRSQAAGAVLESQVGAEAPHPETTSEGEEQSPNTADAVKESEQVEARLEAPLTADGNSTLKKSQKEDGAQPEAPQEAETPPTTTTPAKKKKKKPAPAKHKVGGQTQEQEDAELPVREAGKPRKRKIPVQFEYEADELEAPSTNGVAADGVKKTDTGGPGTPLSFKKTTKTSSSDFITFQHNAAAPTPLFCRTTATSTKKGPPPKSESKKVTFGLKNNKTAEFKKTDRSLLVSPDGSSRVPFNPEHKPKFGVLKSPSTPRSKKIKKTPSSPGKRAPGTPKRRSSAADFF